MRALLRITRDSTRLAGTVRWKWLLPGVTPSTTIILRDNSSPSGYDANGKKPPTDETPAPHHPYPQSTMTPPPPGVGKPLDSDRADWDPSEDWDNYSGEFLADTVEGYIKEDNHPQGRDGSAWARDVAGKGAVYGALGQAEEEPTYELPKDWNTMVSTLCLRTNFEPAELADLYQRFRQLAGKKEYLTAKEFRRTVRRNFGIMKEEWVKKYFQAFDRNHSGTIDFQEYVMGFAGMARVLTDKKAHSLIGLSTGSNIVRSGRNARLFWDGRPSRVAVIKKWKDPVVTAKTAILVEWIQSHDGLTVLLDPSEDDAVGEDGKPLGKRFMPEVQRFDSASLARQADFIICLGGDGTVLKAGQYFDDSTPIPPTLAFGMGSLGFLAPFNPDQCQPMITRVLEAFRRPVSVTLRTRLRGEVYSREGDLERVFYSLNEFIVNRGISGVLSTLEVYVDGQLVTTAQGDGLIVASPSGSTAYNISAGGCMVSPLVPATLITPIAPHSLSFRPILTSASSEITVRIPDTARADGWMSHDATEAVVMKKGSYVKLSTAAIPMPTVNHRVLDGDWFQSIRDKLNWNLRTLQSPLQEDHSNQEALALCSPKGKAIPKQRPNILSGPRAQEDNETRPPNDGLASSSPI